MERLFFLLGDMKDPRVGGADTFVDRLNCHMTVYVLILMAVLITGNQFFVGEPVSCWCPAHFEDSHKDYTNKVSLEILASS